MGETWNSQRLKVCVCMCVRVSMCAIMCVCVLKGSGEKIVKLQIGEII